MYQGKKISVVMPCYNERENIRRAIEDFAAHPAIDEIVAVDNNSKDGSDAEIKATSARYIHETRQGYGAALMRGMREATGDIIVTVEPDGTFRAKDLDRLLVYSPDYSVVFGTRTSRNPIWSGGDPGANMDFALRMGNWAVAKLMEFLFNAPSLTDVGCTFKLLHRDAYETIKDTLHEPGSDFSPHLMMAVLLAKLPVVEIPVQYGTRVGTSKITGKRSRAITLGLEMIFLILKTRLRTLW